MPRIWIEMPLPRCAAGAAKGRTLGGHRRYDAAPVRPSYGVEPSAMPGFYAMTRVHSFGHKACLERHCHEAGFARAEVVTDAG